MFGGGRWVVYVVYIDRVLVWVHFLARGLEFERDEICGSGRRHSTGFAGCVC
jgi:hypothetical protein